MPVLAHRVRHEEGDDASWEDLLRVHHAPYLERLQAAVRQAEAEGGPQEWEGALRVSEGSWAAVVATAGAAVVAAQQVAEGQLRNAFVVGRPPGHGAGPAGAGGHSLVNHVAVAARALQDRGLAERILVVDWDVHPAAGTVAVFEGDPSVLVFSVDEGEPESGADSGSAGPIREQVPAGASSEMYQERFREGLGQAVAQADPDFVLISAGMDLLESDPEGGQRLTPGHVHGLAAEVLDVASATADGRVVAVLEGGYDPAATGEGVAQVLRAFSGLPPAGP